MDKRVVSKVSEGRKFDHITKMLWQATEFDLTGTEWDIYAYIYNLTKDSLHKYTAGFTFLAQIVNTSRTTVSRILNKFIERGLILANSYLNEYNVMVTEYFINREKLPQYIIDDFRKIEY